MHALLKLAIIAIVLTANLPVRADDRDFSRFYVSDEESDISIDYTFLTRAYEGLVIDLGPSTRDKVDDTMAMTGTRMKAKRNRFTYLEGARVPFHEMASPDYQEKLRFLRGVMQDIPDKHPLEQMRYNEQVAYWLNLYNLALMEKLGQRAQLGMKKTLYGKNSVLDERFITVAGMELSLNDIQFGIVYKMDRKTPPLLMYGFFQGVVGSPKIRIDAYTGPELYDQLTANAYEFINSNRGTMWQSGMKASWYYRHNEMLFPDFQNDLKAHLEEHLKEPLLSRLQTANRIRPVLTSFNRADYDSGEPIYGAGLTVQIALRENPGLEDRLGAASRDSRNYRRGQNLLLELEKRALRLRAKVTVEQVDSGNSEEK